MLDRYFAASHKGVTHSVLSAMEEAGKHIVGAFMRLETVRPEILPVQMAFNGNLSCTPWSRPESGVN